MSEEHYIVKSDNITKMIAYRICQLMSEYELNTKQLIRMCDLKTGNTVYKLLAERVGSPRVSTIQKICEGLGITLLEFFDNPIFERKKNED